MRIIRADSYEHMSRAAANLIAAQVLLKPDCVLGLATGSSPVGIYRQLVESYNKGELDFSRVHAVNLDEYAGLEAGHPHSYAYFMREILFRHVNIAPEHTDIPDGMAADAPEECSRYDRLIRSLGGIDLQLLGIGNNGHIGFNEPDDHFSMGTRLVKLAESTRQANRRFFDGIDQVPTHAYSMGIRDILQAKRVVMVASGEGKAQAIKAAFSGPVTPRVPASILQYHPDFVLAADSAALSLM